MYEEITMSDTQEVGVSIDVPGMGPVRIIQPPIERAWEGSWAVSNFRFAAKAMSEGVERLTHVRGDKNLSDAGKLSKLDPIRGEVVATLTGFAAEIEQLENDLDANEAKALAVPALDPVDSAGALMDIEVRNRWAAMTPAERSKLADAFAQGKHPRALEALMRSPIGLDDVHGILIGLEWEKAARARSAILCEQFELGRSAIAWSRRGFAHLFGQAGRVIGWERPQILRSLLSMDPKDKRSAGFKAWGFPDGEIARVKQLMAAEARR